MKALFNALAVAGLAVVAQASTFTDPLTSTTLSPYFSIVQTVANSYDVTPTTDGLKLSWNGSSSASGFKYVSVVFDLADFGGDIASADFDMSVSFHDAVLPTTGSGVNQVEFGYDDPQAAVLSDSAGSQGVHWYNGTIFPAQVGTQTAGTFDVKRVSGVITADFITTGGTHYTLATYGSSSSPNPISNIHFNLNDNGTTSDTSVYFDNFSISSSALTTPTPEPASMFLMAGAGLVAAFRLRRRA